jgi:hypothetical protein
MRKIIFAAILSLVTVLCVSATVAEINNANSIDYASSVTATIAGDGEEIDFDTKTLVVIYNLMPQRVKDLCTASYKDIAPRIEKSKPFTYQGVRITPVVTEDGTDLKFSCNGHTVVVENYTKAEFDAIFGI